ncbi:MAG: 4Fe-4S dicluster domain-containing protein, partial [Thermoleophilia bacterium]|nr:4Fe-4S dicluster domain-containing protein [Thermoleophilia bacterium]
MAELTPYPFGALVHRMHRDLERGLGIFDLPAATFVLDPGRDLSVPFQGHRPASPLGPAAGPQTQMAQNLVLSWLGGCRILELKTVQIQDELDIPRPCIDMRTVGFNVEWSQELKLEQSLDEYVKGAMLIEMLTRGLLPVAADFQELVYDISVGYDLEGVRSERVGEFIRSMMDARRAVDVLRREIPDDYRELRDLDYPTRLADTVTLSTFHGCPPEEIERIIRFLMQEHHLHSIVKFNPMLLGAERTRELLNERLDYADLTVPDSAFGRDASWEQAQEIMEGLAVTAGELGLGLGAKFSNTLIVSNEQGFLPADEAQAYLSGPPLHVLAMHLVRRFRRVFGNRFPISFSAGIDRFNFPDAVALGLTPVTVCTDLLKKRGYGRLQGYYGQLAARMDAVGAQTVDDFVLLAYGNAHSALDELGLEDDHPTLAACRAALTTGSGFAEAAGTELFERWVSEAKLLNTEAYVASLDTNERYCRERNAKPPRKIGSQLELFDCISCDICVPVCPNDANFTFAYPQREIPVVKVERRTNGWQWHHGEALRLEERHQIANFADFCNDCGNCDVFCPEDGGPYVMKPRFFGHEKSWREAPDLDGFFLQRTADGERILGRFQGAEFEAVTGERTCRFAGVGFSIRFERDDPEGTLAGEADGAIDLTYFHLMDYLGRAMLGGESVNYVNTLLE